MKRSGWVKLWVLVVLLALGAGSAGVFWLTRYTRVDLTALEADLATAKTAMQKSTRSPESMIAVRQQVLRLRLAREYNAAFDAKSDADTLAQHWGAYVVASERARESLAKAKAGAQLAGGERW